jgi:flagellar basal-body rod modification protein FlgD
MMSVPSTTNNTTTTTSATTSTTANSSAAISALGPDAFLNLLTTQLKNQDPLNPIDDTQSVAELAQFSQLQASTNLSDSFSTFQQNFGVVQSASLLGRQVTVATTSTSSNGQTSQTTTSNTSGTVSGISVTNGTPSFTLKDANGNTITDSTTGAPETFTASQIINITPATTTSTASTSG